VASAILVEMIRARDCEACWAWIAAQSSDAVVAEDTCAKMSFDKVENK
jgi:hypothetical protein